ncbi:MAG: FAD-dependent monooxygenase [Alphaproteobacteria bacterium]|nr:FAD-dependent monooxygenase [Alphaproteobacteria bacterium]
MTRIAIIGAGLGGLTAALALQRAGFRPVVHEQAAELGEVGAGISVTPNAVKGLVSLGLGAALDPLDAAIPRQRIRSADGTPLFEFDRTTSVTDWGAPYLMMLRADLHALLAAAVQANDPQAIRLRSAVADARGLDADVVVAADGVRSAVRAALVGDEPRFTGHVAWRALVPADRLPADLDLAPGSIVWAGEGRSFVRYPVRGGRFVNLVGLSRGQAWRDEGWSATVPVGEALAVFADFAPEVGALLAAAPDGRLTSWGLFTRPPVERMTHGSVALLGDAAHPMLPFMGQGAAMAIEDGVVLGRCFAAAADPAAALALYDAARTPRTRFIQEQSALGADRLQTRHAPAAAPPKGEDALGIFAYDPATVALEGARDAA